MTFNLLAKPALQLQGFLPFGVHRLVPDGYAWDAFHGHADDVFFRGDQGVKPVSVHNALPPFEIVGGESLVVRKGFAANDLETPGQPIHEALGS